MNQAFRCFLTIMVLVAALSATVMAADRTETFTFEDIRSIDIRTICGGVEILPGEEDRFVVVLDNQLDDPDQLEPEVEASRGKLSIEEDFVGRNVRGSTYWTIYVPKSAELRSVEFSTASGGFTLEDVDVSYVETDIASGGVSINRVKAKEFDLSTASGGIELDDCEVDMVDAESVSGGFSAENVKSEELYLSTASGGVTIELCQVDHLKASSASGGVEANSVTAKEMDLSTASGGIMLDECKIDELAEMSCASGDVRAHLLSLPTDFLHASTASGDVLLEVPDFGENFSMVLTKRADRGRIRCPFKYTDKETIRLHRGDRYLTDRCYVQRGKGGPEIGLSTASGTIEIETETKGK